MHMQEMMENDQAKLRDWIRAEGLGGLLAQYPVGLKSLRALGTMGLGLALSGAGALEPAGVFSAMSLALSALGASGSAKHFFEHLKWPAFHGGGHDGGGQNGERHLVDGAANVQGRWGAVGGRQTRS